MKDLPTVWITAQVKCPLCGHEFQNVWPAGTDMRECSHCNNMVELEITGDGDGE